MTINKPESIHPLREHYARTIERDLLMRLQNLPLLIGVSPDERASRTNDRSQLLVALAELQLIEWSLRAIREELSMHVGAD